MDPRVVLLAVAALCLSIPTVASAHGGGLDRYGCHHNRKAGGYHCHRGPLAGEQFASQPEMLQRLRKFERSSQAGKGTERDKKAGTR